MNVEEFWAMQQLSLPMYFGTDTGKYAKLLKSFSYSDLIRMAGNAFHVSSCGHWMLAVLLLPRFSDFGMLSMPE